MCQFPRGFEAFGGNFLSQAFFRKGTLALQLACRSTANAIVFDFYTKQIFGGKGESQPDFTPFFSMHEAVPDGVFDVGLDKHARDLQEAGVYFRVQFQRKLKFFLESQAFNIHIKLKRLQIARQGDFFGAAIFEHQAEQAAEFLQIFGGSVGVAFLGVAVDAVEAIEDEMRVDLGTKVGELEFGTAALLTLAVGVKNKSRCSQQYQQY